MSEQYEVIRSKSTQELERIIDMSGGAFSRKPERGKYDELMDAIRQKRQERIAEVNKAGEEGTWLEAKEKKDPRKIGKAQHQLHCLRNPWEKR